MENNTVIIDKFVPRNYQIPICDAIENKGYKRVIAIMPRRSGKDLTAWNLCIRQCIRKTCLVYYCLPTYSQAKKTVFDAIAIDGTKFLDYIPKEVITSINTQEMKIRFKNNSILQLIGGDTYDSSLVGTNPYAIVFSEYALMDPKAFQFARPILAANDGWCLILSTPRGRNALWELYNNTKDLPDWFCYKLTVEDTKHISSDVLANERSQMSEELYMQEYMTSFDRGVEGSYYAKYIDELRRKNQIGIVDWEPQLKTFTAWDIGVHDSTCIIFFQVSSHNNVIRIIDCYSNSNVGLDHYAKIILQKPYVYGKHFGPPDLKVREWAGGAVTRIDKARDLGINFTIVPALSIDDGIEGVWTNFHKMWFDEIKCKPLIHALENYRREWDDKLNRYKDHPLHSAESNWADALRYLCAGLSHTEQGITAEELEARYQRAMYGPQAALSYPFGNIPRRF